MVLDINTPKGQEFLQLEQLMLTHITKHFNCSIIQTQKEKASKLDGFLIRDGEIFAAFESKCRNLSLTDLRNFGSYLITHEKLLGCREITKRLCIPLYLFVYLVNDNTVVYWKVTDNSDLCNIEYEIKSSSTQFCCNGGIIIRENAYMKLSNMKLITKDN